MPTNAINSISDSDSRSLQVLIENFGSRFSLEDINAAYCQANHNVNRAGEILFAMTEKMPKTERVDMNGTILEPTSCNTPPEEHQEDMKIRVSKPKKTSASVGTVSSVIGKEYVRIRPLTNAHREATKPLKIDSKDVPENEIWAEEMPENLKANNDRMRTDVEEFLLKMLGEGFQVKPSVIHEVLGSCGYDAQKSIDKLLDMPGIKMHAEDGMPTEMRRDDNEPKNRGSNSFDSVVLQDSAQSVPASNLKNPRKEGKDKTDLQREVLEALFSGAEKFEEPAIIRRVGHRRARAAGTPVTKPLDLEEPNHNRVVVVKQRPQALKEDEHLENGFEALRKATTEYWTMMKEYYKAAVEAFLKGDTERAYRLLEKGRYFNLKAREADEKSIAELVEVKEEKGVTYEEDEVVTVNLHDYEPKEALRVLKHQLTCFSGISYFKYLRFIVGVNEEDIKSSRKRLMVKLLERESIVWSEEDNGLTMMIRVDEINPKNLSFAKKKA